MSTSMVTKSAPPRWTARFAYDASDDDETRHQKQAIFMVAGGCTVCGLAWTAMYWLCFGACLATALPFSFVVIVGGALAYSHVSRNHWPAVYAQILCIIYITALIQWSIGGVFDSGFVLAWAFCGPITALAFFPLRKAAVFLALDILNVAITLGFEDTFASNALPSSDLLRHMFFAMNLGMSSLLVFVFASYFAGSAESQRVRAEHLETSLAEATAMQLGPYTLEEQLGAGGMGVVYKARHALLRRPTAVKLLLVDNIGHDSLARFEREVQNTANLMHPNIVAIHDYGHNADGVFYYAMEYLDGVDLETLVLREGPLSAARAANILRQVCDALYEAHQRGLVHRDVKPANVMLCRIGSRADVVKVLDFGLVKELDAESALTQEPSVAGTPAFISPEAVTDPLSIGPAADLYGVGALAYWLLAGCTVFEGKTLMDVCAHHVHSAPASPSFHVPTIPAALDALVLRCLAKSPHQRPASAREIVNTLDACASTFASPWTAEQAHVWWDEFELERAERPDLSLSFSSLTLTIDVAERLRDNSVLVTDNGSADVPLTVRRGPGAANAPKRKAG